MKRFLATTTLLLVFLLPAMLHAASEQPKSGGTLTMAIRKDLTTMNPLVRTSSTDRAIREVMYESLLDLDLKGNLQPKLAEAWEVSKSGTEITFNLRKGVKFHNGQEMTAEDAKFAIDYTMNKKNAAYGYSLLDIVERVEAPDKYTLRLRLEKPAPGFIYTLSSIRAFSVVPKGSLEEGAVKIKTYPPGTGPFQFKEWQPRQRLTLQRFDDYWGQKALVDELVLRPIPDATIRMTALRAGDVDLVETAPYEWARQIIDGKLEGITVAGAPDAGFRVLKFNAAAPPFNNRKLRLAVAHALNKGEWLRAGYFGFGEPTDQRYPKGHAWYFEEVRTPKYDLEQARALLKEAGYKGEVIEFDLRQGEQEIEATTIQAQLKRIGLNVQLKVSDYGTYTDRQRKGEFNLRPSGGDYLPDPLSTYADQFRCPLDFQKRTSNDTGYCDKEMDSLIDKAETETDPEKRKELVRRIVQKLYAEDVPEVPIGFVPRFFALRNHVKGFKTNRLGDFQWLNGGLSYVWLDK
jgi:ABC-type transport system substrate-binding protein